MELDLVYCTLVLCLGYCFKYHVFFCHVIDYKLSNDLFYNMIEYINNDQYKK